MTRCAVLGSPIGHSLSPVLHRAAYLELGLHDWRYDAFDVDESGLADFVAGLGEPDASADRWRGLSLTKPLKAAALSLGVGDSQVRLTGAANTLIIEPDRTRRLYNTDIDGLSQALRAAGVDALDRVAILGAGGTTRAALVSVAALGARTVQVLARRPEQLTALAPLAEAVGLRLRGSDFGAEIEPADLLISTVTAAAAETLLPRLAGQGRLDSDVVVFDAVYDPWPTPLAAATGRAGATVVSGLDLLVHQAVGQLRLMTGRTVPAERLLSAGRKALSERSTA